jgi:hypothetical protein
MVSAIKQPCPTQRGLLFLAGLLTYGSLYSLSLPAPGGRDLPSEQWRIIRFHPRSQR